MSRRSACGDPAALEAVLDIVDHPHPGKHAVLLEHHAALAAGRRDRLAGDHDVAAGWRQQAGHHLQQACSCRSRTGRRGRRTRLPRTTTETSSTALDRLAVGTPERAVDMHQLDHARSRSAACSIGSASSCGQRSRRRYGRPPAPASASARIAAKPEQQQRRHDALRVGGPGQDLERSCRCPTASPAARRWLRGPRRRRARSARRPGSPAPCAGIRMSRTHLPRRRAQRPRGVLVDRVEIGRGPLRDRRRGSRPRRRRPGKPHSIRPTPNQISRKGAATRIGTVPAVIMIGSIDGADQREAGGAEAEQDPDRGADQHGDGDVLRRVEQIADRDWRRSARNRPATVPTGSRSNRRSTTPSGRRQDDRRQTQGQQLPANQEDDRRRRSATDRAPPAAPSRRRGAGSDRAIGGAAPAPATITCSSIGSSARRGKRQAIGVEEVVIVVEQLRLVEQRRLVGVRRRAFEPGPAARPSWRGNRPSDARSAPPQTTSSGVIFPAGMMSCASKSLMIAVQTLA